MVERVRLSEMLVRCLPRCLPRAGAPRPVASRPDNAGDVERVGRAAVAMLEAETTPVAHRRRAADTAAGADSRVPEHKPEPCGRAQRRRHVQVRRQARGRAVLESAHCSGPPRQPLAHESCRARCGDAFGDDHELSPGPTPLRWRPAFVRRAADDRFVGETSVAKAPSPNRRATSSRRSCGRGLLSTTCSGCGSLPASASRRASRSSRRCSRALPRCCRSSAGSPYGPKSRGDRPPPRARAGERGADTLAS
jgi:hypothetical protein